VHNKPDDFVPSRLFIYYLERKMEGSIYTDAGAQIRDGIKAVATHGVSPESKWPYDGVAGDPATHVFPGHARAVQEPPEAVMQEARKYKTISYAPLAQDVAVLESCIAGGYPFIFGFTIFDNFRFGTTVLRKPGLNDKITPYGHAVIATGYDQAKRTFRIRNSWGPAANANGYFEMDYDYVLGSSLASDFWVVYQTLGFL
jgi:C1A family cysteine protease